MKGKVITTCILSAAINASAGNMMNYRGVVYDVGLQFNEGQYSVDSFNAEAVKYDMSIISNILRCNAVRIEGEDIDRLKQATVLAHDAGLKVFFNPWLMGAEADEVAAYMSEAAKTAEELAKQGIDLTFITGCEFSLFNKGVFEGNTINERLNSMMTGMANCNGDLEKLKQNKEECDKRLNAVLARISKAVKENFSGKVAYSSGTWEGVDWSLFDIIGVDYYRDKQTDQEYLDGLKPYLAIGKPVWVMEVGCCTFEGAAALGGGGFTVCLGVDENGEGIYAGGEKPKRSEREQADYDERQIRLLCGSGIEGMFIYLFSFPISPYREKGYDADLTAYPIVRSYPSDDPRSHKLPAWEPKEAFYRIAQTYSEIERLSVSGN